jgi:outer membrane murein-binding lipoprotein Lpp
MRVYVTGLLLCMLILTGCSREQGFDKKYEATGAKLKAEMQRLDKEMDAELKREPGEQAASGKDTEPN